MINLPLLREVARAIQNDKDATWPDSGRVCGDCQACCEVLEVRDIPDKPKWGRCRHQCGDGCAIYDDRPPICRDFQCLWRAGLLRDDAEPMNRPEQLGVVMCFDADGNSEVIHAHECWPGAVEEPRARLVLGQVARKWVVVVHHFGRNDLSMAGPEWMVTAWLEAHAPLAAARVKEVLVRR